MKKTLGTGSKLIRMNEGVIIRKKLKVSPFREAIETLTTFGTKYKKENSEVMQLLVKLLTNSLHGEQTRKDFEKNVLVNQNIGC